MAKKIKVDSCGNCEYMYSDMRGYGCGQANIRLKDYTKINPDCPLPDYDDNGLKNELVMAEQLLSWIDDILDGKEASDFAESFPIIRKLQDRLYSNDGFQWISVGERLPEEAGDYLVWGPNFDMQVIYFEDPKLMLDEGYITHWSPLPPPPKGV